MELLKLTKKGLYCELGDFYIDPWDKVDTAIITHAHGDHARWGMNNYITVDENEFILRKRISETGGRNIRLQKGQEAMIVTNSGMDLIRKI